LPRRLQYFHDSEYTGAHAPEVALGGIMSDAQITEESGTEAEVPDQPPTPAESDEADDTADDHLAPVRVASLPPVPRPPPSKRISVPPPLHSVPASVAANGVAAAGSARGGRPAMPSAMAAERLSRRLLAGVCLVVALALGVSGLVVGLSAPSSDLGPASSVLAAVVVARALMGVGMLGAGLVFLRMGERWFTLELGKLDPGGPDSRDSDR
jgi:hypothetical protein